MQYIFTSNHDIMSFVVFQFAESRLTHVSQFSIGEVKYSSEMCYVNGNIIMTGFTPKTIRVYHEETGSLLNEWNTCHMFPRLMAFETDGKEYLLEGCIYCKVIRGYEFPETSSSHTPFHKHITPHVMCKGPTDTILLFESRNP